MKIVTGVVLMLLIPMIFLNPLGWPAFLGYYTGVIATWVVYTIALRRTPPKSSARRSI
jgi:hypothetical protein